MAEGDIGILQALWRFVTFYRMRKALGLARAADQQFTGSTGGIRDAFDIHRERLIKQFNELRGAVAEVEAVLESKRSELERLNTEEEETLQKRDGALSLAERATESGDTAEYEKHASAFARFQGRIDEIEARQERLEVELKETSGIMEKHLINLQEMSGEIRKMPQQKAEAIADHVSAQKIIELNDRLQGLQSSMERGPIEAVLEANRKLTAKARITEKLAGTDAAVADKAYSRAGRNMSGNDALEKMLAARKAEREKSSAGGNEKDKADRPKI